MRRAGEAGWTTLSDVRAETRARLMDAFPRCLRTHVEAALLVVPPGQHEHSERHIGPVVLAGEALRIPARIYAPEPATVLLSRLSVTERRVVQCLYTRHHDGRVRQRYLEALLSSDEAWAAPFVVQLLGEYVLEILQVLDRGRNDLVRPAFAGFVAENPAFMILTRQRVVSYWNCYYRHRFPKRPDYPGFRALAVLESGHAEPPVG